MSAAESEVASKTEESDAAQTAIAEGGTDETPTAKKPKTDAVEASDAPDATGTDDAVDAPPADGDAPAPAEPVDNALLPRPFGGRDPSCAMLWFYKDKDGVRQGPFYPGQMRQWWVSGFFPVTQLVGASFKGDVPREFVEVYRIFPDARETDKSVAFIAREGITLWPPAFAPPPPDEDEIYRQPQHTKRPQWLEDSLRRQKAGIKRKMIYGPVERENYN